MKHIAILILLLLIALNLFCGSVSIPAADVLAILTEGETSNEGWRYIVLQMRLPSALTALFTGAALGTAGLMLQSYFRNPLAGPSILGITSGANLAVGIMVLAMGSISGFALVSAAMAGSMAVMAVLLILARRVRQNVTLLIVGILVSYLASALLTLMQFNASAEGIQMLMVWGMGSFNQVGMAQMPLFASLIILSLIASLWLIRPLNGWMLGEDYARNLGISVTAVRWCVLIFTGLLCAVTTAWCGPIAFVGLSVPHMARIICRTDNHRSLLPMSMLLGSCCTLLCLWLSTLPDGGRTLPINALTPLFGIPVILYVLLRKE